jgi:hypothetical protein
MQQFTDRIVYSQTRYLKIDSENVSRFIELLPAECQAGAARLAELVRKGEIFRTCREDEDEALYTRSDAKAGRHSR